MFVKIKCQGFIVTPSVQRTPTEQSGGLLIVLIHKLIITIALLPLTLRLIIVP